MTAIKERNSTKKANKIKSDTFIVSNREKSKTAIAILENE